MLITALVNGHREGRLLSATLGSVERARKVAALDVEEMEVLLVLDRPDNLTEEVAAECSDLVSRTIVVDHGDLGLARNSGVREARGLAIATLDGDDLWGSGWVKRGLARLKQEGARTVLHGHISQYFENDETGWQSPCMSDPSFRVVSLFGGNPWTSVAMAHRETFRRIPYRPTPHDRGFAYEDWAWNCDTIAAGYSHLIVPRTIHFIRRRSGSLSRHSHGQRALPIPNNLSLRRALELDSLRAVWLHKGESDGGN